MASLRVVVAEDHALMRDAIRLVLDEADDFEVVGEAESGLQVLPLVMRTLPDVALLDMRLPGLDGLACLELIRQRHPEMTVVMLSALDEPEQIAAALRRGARAYIVKSINPADLPGALRQTLEGSFFSASSLENGADDAARALGLSGKELDVLRQLAQGLSNREIAKTLWISEQTVKFHLRNIYRKLDISNRTEAVRYAYERHLVESPALQHA